MLFDPGDGGPPIEVPDGFSLERVHAGQRELKAVHERRMAYARSLRRQGFKVDEVAELTGDWPSGYGAVETPVETLSTDPRELVGDCTMPIRSGLGNYYPCVACSEGRPEPIMKPREDSPLDRYDPLSTDQRQVRTVPLPEPVEPPSEPLEAATAPSRLDPALKKLAKAGYNPLSHPKFAHLSEADRRRYL